ncbi:MAG: PKD domain-containing protein [Candidatus Thermoplasmatota archaeon]
MWKKAIFLSLLLVSSFFQFFSFGQEEKAKWSVFVYLDADSSQHGGALPSYYKMIENLETIGNGSDENINVVVLMDRHPIYAPDGDGGTHAYYVQKGYGNSKEIPLPLINSTWVSEVNMGSRYTLADFVIYGIKNYPAEHYALVTRSAGWWPDNFCEDETNEDNMNVFELRSALVRIKQANNNKNLDILVIGACTSGMFEWAYDIKDYVDYFVGTETYSIGPYWRIYNWVAKLKKEPYADGADFANIVVNEYVNETRDDYDARNSLTASGIDLRKLPAVANATNKLAMELKKDIEMNTHNIWLAKLETEQIDNYLRVDLYHFAENVYKYFSSPIKEIAKELMNAINTSVVANGKHTGEGIDVSSAHGLSIFFTSDRQAHWDSAVSGYRSRLRYSFEGDWLSFLDIYYSYYHETTIFPSISGTINMFTAPIDVDWDGYNDDVFCVVRTSDDKPVFGASIYIDNVFKGKTDKEGRFAAFNYQYGNHPVRMEYKEYSSFSIFSSQGFGGYQIFLNVSVADLDVGGLKNDAIIMVIDIFGRVIPGVVVFSYSGYVGWTDENGLLFAYNFPEGTHYLFAYIYEGVFAVNSFYSEGMGEYKIIVDAKAYDYENDGLLNDGLIDVFDNVGDKISNAIVYVDDKYIGKSYDGKACGYNYNVGWHNVDVYYTTKELQTGTYFKELYLGLIDLNYDGLDDTVSILYDVESMGEERVTVIAQILTDEGIFKAMMTDNFTVFKGQIEYRSLNYTANYTDFYNIYITLVDSKGYILEKREYIGVWLESPKNAIPIAYLFVRPQKAEVNELITFNGTQSYDEDGYIMLYYFDFGDGSSSGWVSEAVVSHTYSFSGNYTTKCIVKDNRGRESKWSNKVIVTIGELEINKAPKARLFVRPIIADKWENITFNATTSEDIDGYIKLYYFDFGDGSTSGWLSYGVVVHSYASPGNYTTKVKVMDDKGKESDWSNKVTITVEAKEINKLPIASLSVRPLKPKVNQTVVFNASGSSDKDGYVFRYFFDFGDGTNSDWVSDSVVMHTYTTSGTYTAKLIVEDDRGAVSKWTKGTTIDVIGNELPKAYLYVKNKKASIGEEVKFDGSGSTDPDGTVASYLFEFGDGTNTGWTPMAIVSHKYQKQGKYVVNLSVIDDRNGMSKWKSQVTIVIEKGAVQPMAQQLSILVACLFLIFIFVGLYREFRRKIEVTVRNVRCLSCGEMISTSEEIIKCPKCGKEGRVR